MIVLHGEWVHFARGSEEWWFRQSDIAGVQTKGEVGRPICFPDPWHGVVYLKGVSDIGADYDSGILMYKDEIDCLRRVLLIGRANS